LQQLQASLEAELDNLQSTKTSLDGALAVSREENQILLGELINAKMSVGNLSTELDEANRQLRLLRANGNVPIDSVGASSNGSRRPPPANNIFANTSNGERGGSSGSSKQSTPQNMKPPQAMINPFSDVNSPLAGTSVLMRGFGSTSNAAANNSSYNNKDAPAPVKNPFAAANTPHNYNNSNTTNNAASQHQQYLQQQRQSLQLQQQKKGVH